jgi:RNA methyltransferase, TrmH family
MIKENLKYYSSLLSKKNRELERKFTVEGIKLITEAINSGYSCEILMFTNQFAEEEKSFLSNIKKKKIVTEIIKQNELDKLCDTKTPQGIAGVFNYKNNITSPDPGNSGPVIAALENITDPGNMGVILRNCDWFGINKIIVSQGCVEILNPKVIRSSAGSVFHLDIYESGNFYKELEMLKKHNYDIITADLDGSDLYSYKKKKNIVIVLSNEANGPSKQILELSDKIITIPKKGKAESLNVGSASAVILAELTK